jgi:cell shape-determining protein MreC
MKRLTRISLLTAAVAGLFICGANTIHLKQRITRLRTDLQNQTASREQAETALAQAERDKRHLTASLKQTEADMEIAVEERQTAMNAANILKVRLLESAGETMRIGRERDEARQELSRYKLAGLEPEEVLKAALYIRVLESSVTRLQAENQALHKRIVSALLASGSDTPSLPADLKAKVVAYDPKWRFLVLDAGESQGVLPKGELLVSREGKLVAKVKISRVEADRSIANLVPNWELGEIMEGDVAIPAPI